jgi:hyperosmotically inducible protein
MSKLFSTLCLVVSLAVCSSGCTNTSRGSNEQHRRAGTVINDSTITAEIKGKYIADSEVSAFRIDVDTFKGVVTLSGTVPSQRAYDRAVQLARETKGVARVISKLTIR